jgi:hypothetical protein
MHRPLLRAASWDEWAHGVGERQRSLSILLHCIRGARLSAYAYQRVTTRTSACLMIVFIHWLNSKKTRNIIDNKRTKCTKYIIKLIIDRAHPPWEKRTFGAPVNKGRVPNHVPNHVSTLPGPTLQREQVVHRLDSCRGVFE